jgi:hypothetical protein
MWRKFIRILQDGLVIMVFASTIFGGYIALLSFLAANENTPLKDVDFFASTSGTILGGLVLVAFILMVVVIVHDYRWRRDNGLIQEFYAKKNRKLKERLIRLPAVIDVLQDYLGGIYFRHKDMLFEIIIDDGGGEFRHQPREIFKLRRKPFLCPTCKVQYRARNTNLSKNFRWICEECQREAANWGSLNYLHRSAEIAMRKKIDEFEKNNPKLFHKKTQKTG